MATKRNTPATRAPKKTATPAPAAVDGQAATAGRRLSPAERRAQILEAARDLFSARAYPDIGIRDVAERAGITEGLVYHYFESRTGLFAAAVEASSTELLVACIPDGTLSFPAQFEQGMGGYLDYVEAHRVAYLNLFRGPAAQEPAFQPLLDATRNAIIEHILHVLGLTEQPVPVIRTALRGYIGYIEAAVLHWLQYPLVEREVLERMIYPVILAVLSSSFAAEPDSPISREEVQRLEQEFRTHFKL